MRQERTSDQLLRSGTSVGAHFREAQRAKSNADFISKIEGGMQELEETAYWLELLEGAIFCGRDQFGAFGKRGGPIDGDFRNDCT